MNIGDVWVYCTKSDGLEKVKYVICVVLKELLLELHNIPVNLDRLWLKFPFNRWENWGAETNWFAQGPKTYRGTLFNRNIMQVIYLIWSLPVATFKKLETEKFKNI